MIRVGRQAWICLALAALLHGAPGRVRAANLEAKPSAVQFLPIDEDVTDQVKTVDKLVKQKEWRKAIEICQKLIAKPPKTVVEIRKGVYGSPRALCESKLLAMPEPARLLYRTLYDPEAERLYRRALEDRSVADARRLVAEFACTSHGVDGTALLADLLFEKGDVRGALDHWMRWIAAADVKSIKEPVRRRVAVKAAVAAARLGDRAALDKAVELFGPKGALVESGPARIARADELKTFAATLWLKDAAPQHAGPSALDFKRWSLSGNNRYGEQIARHYGSSSQTSFSCHGQLSGGVFYMSGPDGVRAFNAVTGQVVWRRTGRNYGSEHYYALRAFNFYCTVHPAAGRDGNGILFASGGSRLAAHDARTGKLLWAKVRTSFAAVEAIGQDAELRVAFSSPVLYRRGVVYVILETSRGQVYLLAARAANGAVLWVTGIGGGAQQQGYRLSFPAALTACGSDIVFCSGRGVIGKCDAATGEVRWLLPYRRREQFAKGRSYYRVGSLRYQPLAKLGDSVFCIPSDGQQLISVRVSDGRVNWEKEIALGQSLTGAALPAEGEKSGRLFLAGARVECRAAETGSMIWNWPVPETEPVGAGRLTAAGVTIATRRGVYVLSSKTGELTRFRPLSLPGWSNILIALDVDSLILTSKNGLTSLGGKERTGELLQTAPPKGAEPWILAMRARLSQSGGQTEDALRFYSEAIKTAKRRSGTTTLAARLESEALDLLHKRQEAEWKAGQPIEGFLWMSRALRFSARLPYECTLGYRAGAAAPAAGPHTVVMTSGDRISGKLAAVSNDTVALVVQGQVWHIAARGVDRIVVSQTGAGKGKLGPGRQHVLLANGDRVSGSIEAVTEETLTLRTGFGVIKLKVSEVAEIVLRGGALEPADNAVYLTLRNGDRLSGRVRAFDGVRFTVDIPFCGTRSIGLGAVRSVSNRRVMPPRGSGRGGGGRSAPVSPRLGL